MEKMMAFYPKSYDPEIFKEALSALLKQKGYHEAPPTKKNELLLREYRKILDKKISDTPCRKRFIRKGRRNYFLIDGL